MCICNKLIAYIHVNLMKTINNACNELLYI